MLRENVSTTRFVPDSRLLAIRMTHALWHSSVLTAERIMHLTIESAVFRRENMIFNRLGYQTMFLIFEARKVYQQAHGQSVINYAGTVRAPIQKGSMCYGMGLILLHGGNILLFLSLSIRLTISGSYHSNGGCEENCGSD